MDLCEVKIVSKSSYPSLCACFCSNEILKRKKFKIKKFYANNKVQQNIKEGKKYHQHTSSYTHNNNSQTYSSIKPAKMSPTSSGLCLMSSSTASTCTFNHLYKIILIILIIAISMEDVCCELNKNCE